MIMMMTAITIRRWIRPPPTWPMKPRSQSTSRITTIVQSMVFLSIELAVIAPERRDSIKQKLSAWRAINKQPIMAGAAHADLSFGPQYHQRLLDTVCCHLVAGRVRDQEVGLSGKQSATIALHDTDIARRFFAGERPSAVRSAQPSRHSTR